MLIIEANMRYSTLQELVRRFYPAGVPLFRWVPDEVKKAQQDLYLAIDRLSAYREANSPV